MPNERRVVATDRAPGALGPYSQAVAAGGFLFASGQLGLDPATGQLAGETAPAQARRALANLQAVVEAAGLTLADAVKTTLYLRRLDDFAAVNEVYGEFFGDRPPARAVAEVSRLPKDALVEIDLIARDPRVR